MQLEQTVRPNDTSSRSSSATVDLRWFREARGAERQKAARAFMRSAADHGFLYLVGHEVEEFALECVYSQARAFFARPLDEKLRYEIARRPNHRGYVGVHERGEYADEGTERRYEAFDLGVGSDRDVDPTNPLVGPNCWPDQAGFRWVISNYLRQMRRLSREIATMIAVALGQPDDALWRHMTNPVSQLRLIHYLPKATPTAGKIGMGAHTDYECFTILQASRPNLQVLRPDGTWQDLPPKPGAYYFNIGDICEAWTGGLLKATSHRVVDTGDERFSLPYFCATNYDTVVRPLPASDPEMRMRQQHYEPIHAGSHLLTQLLRDFGYLRKRAEEQPLAVRRWSESPFESRIRQTA